jgi:hypothetical protein
LYSCIAGIFPVLIEFGAWLFNLYTGKIAVMRWILFGVR